MDEELKQHLQAMEQRLKTQIAELKTQIAELRIYVDDRCEHVETTLLTEFHKWASPVEMRLRSHSSVLPTLDMDFEALADRIKRIEGREPNQPH